MSAIKRTALVLFVSLLLWGNVLTAFPHEAYAGDSEWSVNSGLNTHVSSICSMEGNYRNINQEETGDVMVSLAGSWKQSSYKDALTQLRSENTPNTVSAIQKIPASGIDKLSITSDLCGVLVEPSISNQFTVDYVGVKNPSSFTVSISVDKGVLLVGVKGVKAAPLLISTVRDDLINIVRIGVPANTLKDIIIDDDNGCLLIDNLDIPVSAKTKSGLIRVQGDILTSVISMETANGDLLVKATTVKGDVTLNVANGDACIKAKTVAGKTVMTAANGDVAVEADLVQDVTMNVANGDVRVQADTVQKAVFSAANGDLNIEMNTVGQSVTAGVANGDIQFKLKKQPDNLTFILNRSKNSDYVRLPKGWRNGFMVGNGKPVLQLKVGSGDLNFTVG